MATVTVDKMERLKSHRKQVRRQYTKAETVLSEVLSLDLPSLTDLRAAYVVLESKALQLSNLDNEIMSCWLDMESRDEGAFDKDVDVADEYLNRWHNVKEMYMERIRKMEKASDTLSSSNTVKKNNELSDSDDENKSSRCKVCLPKLELVKFDGTIKKWLTFWGLFRKIDEDKKMDNVEKFQYLLQSMEPGSNAKELVESFPPSGDNYLKAIKLLKERFARDELLIETYVHELLQIVLTQSKTNYKITIRSLYDKLMTQLQALETLGVTQDKYAAMLLPLVESALPEEILRTWSRLHLRIKNDDNRLNQLLDFLKCEVESEERIKLAHSGFKNEYNNVNPTIPSTACFTSGVTRDTQYESKKQATCLWCGRNNHISLECRTAMKMSLEERKAYIMKEKACSICLKRGHFAKKCKGFPKCIVCSKRHTTLMCPDISKTSKPTAENNEVLLCHKTDTVLLQTLLVQLINKEKKVVVRALLDSGAQRSFLKNDIAELLDLKTVNTETISHCIFGGKETMKEAHNIYSLNIKSIDNSYRCNISVIGENVICGYLPKVRPGNLMNQLIKKGITLTDCNDMSNNKNEISLLIGADVSGSLLTGESVQLEENLVAINTKLGWTIQGPAPGVYCSTINDFTTLNCVTRFDIADFWSLETIGIKDPVEIKQKEAREAEIMTEFKKSITINEEQRYQVNLPWKDYKLNLGNNYELALKRLNSTTRRLIKLNKLSDYDEIFNDWLNRNIIEEVSIDNNQEGHYLAHHPVIKESSLTTKIRPVFDASVQDNNKLSLNNCLEKGINMLENIPRLLIQFRRRAIGITADIEKAFLQISIAPDDRKYLKFLWWHNNGNKSNDGNVLKIKTYRHRRVVFGVTTSPFLLSATINYHLDKYSDPIAKKLKESFYVDNAVTSVDTEEEMNEFIDKSQKMMLDGKFILRGWVTSPSKVDNNVNNVSVLGIIWDTKKDKLYCNMSFLNSMDSTKITKRLILSVAQSIFDPIGFTSPTTIVPKYLLQKTWSTKIAWDDKVPEDLQREFMNWYKYLHILRECCVPRTLCQGSIDKDKMSIHVFCDASKYAYAACVFIRVESKNEISLQLVLAKSRVAPIKPVTIPRLELIAAVLATRLSSQVKSALNLGSCKYFYWTDASVALHWIKNDDKWNIFVRNRVNEIRSKTNSNDWRHISGVLNPADLPSRGCHAKYLMESKWWLGPQWLKYPEEQWPQSEVIFDNIEVIKEKVSEVLCTTCDYLLFSEEFQYFSKYSKIIRTMAWMVRFQYNCQKKDNKMKGELNSEEVDVAEKIIFRIIQKETYKDEFKKTLNLDIIKDTDELLKVRTRLTLSDDYENFIYPILLPAKHYIIVRLVSQKHIELNHAGTLTLITCLRENYWIIGLRRLVKKVVRECIKCRRFQSQHFSPPTAPLPVDRIRRGAAFDVTGIDLAGPLYLRSGEKVWIVIFTCATYRAVHLELVNSLTTEAFIYALRRFIARRGRVHTIYTDNGTNFIGAYNALKNIEWNKVLARSSLNKLKWNFSPPRAPWWGGFWERLIRVVKDMLRRILGKSSLDYIELETILVECEATINSRPLTYISENTENLKPLTPQMFIQSIPHSTTTDLDEIDANSLNIRLRYLQQLRDNFKSRFRIEYLSTLVQNRTKKSDDEIKVGDVVIIEADTKRVEWPLGLVLKLYEGTDGESRVAKLRTAHGERIRAVQRLYPLEVRSATEIASNESRVEEQEGTDKPKMKKVVDNVDETTTRSGRRVKPARRLDL